jgi:hypothetical protein
VGVPLTAAAPLLLLELLLELLLLELLLALALAEVPLELPPPHAHNAAAIEAVINHRAGYFDIMTPRDQPAIIPVGNLT